MILWCTVFCSLANQLIGLATVFLLRSCIVGARKMTALYASFDGSLNLFLSAWLRSSFRRFLTGMDIV